MKRVIPHITVLVALVLGIIDSNAQFRIRKSNVSSFIYGDVLSNPSGDGSLAEKRVSIDALKAFSHSFQNVNEVKWYRLNQYYLVYFIKNGNENKALYDVKGRLRYSISYGTVKDLPGDIRKMVKRQYVEYNILQAIEVKENSRNIWIIKLDDDDSLVTVRSENGDFEEMARYKKQK